MANPPPTERSASTPAPAAGLRFVNEMRLGVRHWLAVAALVAMALWLTPRVWQGIERFDIGPDHRIPYA